MQYIVTATIQRTERGITEDTVTSENVIHCIAAVSQEQAEGILTEYYLARNKDDAGPYGDRYWVESVKCFPPLSLADLQR